MGMLFLPAGVSVILYADVLEAEWLPILTIIIVSSVTVLGSTAFLLQSMLKKKEVK